MERGGVSIREGEREGGWAVLRRRRWRGRWEEGEGTVLPFTLAAFGLRMSCFFF